MYRCIGRLWERKTDHPRRNRLALRSWSEQPITAEGISRPLHKTITAAPDATTGAGLLFNAQCLVALLALLRDSKPISSPHRQGRLMSLHRRKNSVQLVGSVLSRLRRQLARVPLLCGCRRFEIHSSESGRLRCRAVLVPTAVTQPPRWLTDPRPIGVAVTT